MHTPTTSPRPAGTRARKRKPKKLPRCTAKDLRTPTRKRRKCRVVHKPSPTGPVAAPPATTPSVDAFPAGVGGYAGLATYSGPWGVAQATRLLLRAGFGPKPGQAEEFAGLGVTDAVYRLMYPTSHERVGPAPTGTYLVNGALSPKDKYGHTHLDMLDRFVRSEDQLGERMTLVLHDWFSVSDAAVDRQFVSPHLDLLRQRWRGSFRDLLIEVTQDPAMLLFLNGTSNRKGAPNENYARELQELYALGADRGAYTEADVREMARALTGFRNDYDVATGPYNFRYDAARHDTGTKTIYAGTRNERSGALTWQDGVNAVVDHAQHPSFVVLKLWSYFVPTAPAPETQAALEALYRQSGEQLLPLVHAILLHPDLYESPAMVMAPAVYAARLMRSRGAGITTDAWIWMLNNAGQLLGQPPNVAGWNDRAWLSTSTHIARWQVVRQLIAEAAVKSTDYTNVTETPDAALASARAFWGNQAVSADTLAAATAVASETWTKGTPGDQYGSLATFLAVRQNVLRQVLAAAPDAQVC